MEMKRMLIVEVPVTNVRLVDHVVLMEIVKTGCFVPLTIFAEYIHVRTRSRISQRHMLIVEVQIAVLVKQ